MLLNIARPKKLDRPEHYAGGYSLHLYCDHENGSHRFREFPHEYDGETFSECARAAKKDGWKINRNERTATCPRCAK